MGLFRQLSIEDAADEEENSSQTSDERDEEGEEVADDTPLGVDLTSLYLLSDQENATMSPDPGDKAVVIEKGLPAPEGLTSRLEPFLGKPLSMALLSEISKEIILSWRSSDYPLIDVYYPEQNITKGKLQIVVKEAVLGEKAVEGAVRSREEYLLKNFRVSPGDRINQRLVDEDLDWLNANPFRRVNAIYEKGEADGTSDILLDVTEKELLTGFVGFANTGVKFTGEEEWSFGFLLANPYQTEQSLAYYFASDLEWQNLAAHSMSHQLYLPWRHISRVFGAYVLSSAEDVSVTDTEGVSRQLSYEYEIPLGRADWNRRWQHNFRFGFDYKSTNTDLIFGGTNFLNSELELGQFRGQYGFTVPDDKGFTQGFVGVAASPGNMFRNHDDASFDAARLGSTAKYWYGFAEFERIQQLPRDFSLRLKVHAQATSDRLSATEQLLAGGYRTVRGFDESVIRGDSGVLTNLELISPEFAVSQIFSESCEDRWNAFVFYDTAALSIEDKLPGEVSPSLQSVGLGLHCRVGERGFARASYGWGVQDHGLFPTDKIDGKFHFGVTLTY